MVRELSRKASARSGVFFFQAEDGIRDGHVTGVQTCALPIYAMLHRDAGKEKQWYHGSTVAASPIPALSVPELSREDPCQQPDVQEEVAAQSEDRKSVV